MPGFGNFQDMVNEVYNGGSTNAGGKILRWDFIKSNATGNMQGAGVWCSLWKQAGSPAAGADPATTPGTVYTNTAGSMNWPNQSPDLKTLITLGAAIQSVSSTGVLMLYDRLVGISGISLASTGSKTISSSALPRYTNGNNVQAWLEVTTATTVTAPIVHLLSYTGDTLGAGQVGGSLSFPAAATKATSMIGPLPLAVGDGGLTAISTLNCDTAGSAGIVNVVLLRPLAYLIGITQQWNEKDFVLESSTMPQIFDGATLGLMWLATSTNAITFSGNLVVAYG